MGGNLGGGILVWTSPRCKSFKRCSSCPPGGHDQWHRRIVLGWIYWWRGLELAIVTHMVAIATVYIVVPAFL